MAVSFGKDMTTITNERHLANTATANGAIEIFWQVAPRTYRR